MISGSFWWGKHWFFTHRSLSIIFPICLVSFQITFFEEYFSKTIPIKIIIVGFSYLRNTKNPTQIRLEPFAKYLGSYIDFKFEKLFEKFSAIYMINGIHKISYVIIRTLIVPAISQFSHLGFCNHLIILVVLKRQDNTIIEDLFENWFQIFMRICKVFLISLCA